MRFSERLPRQLTVRDAPHSGARDQTRTLEHPQMFGNGRRRDRERFAQRANQTRSAGQPLQHRTPRRIRERAEHGAERVVLLFHAGVIGDGRTTSGFSRSAAPITSSASLFATPRLCSVAVTCSIKRVHSASVIPRPACDVFMSRPR